MSEFFTKINKAFLLTAVLVLTLSACGKEPVNRKKGSSQIVPVLKSVSTKAAGDNTADFRAPGRLISERVVASADGFDLIEMVYENELPPFETSTATKGTVVTNGNISSFGMAAYPEGQWHYNTLAPEEQGSATLPNAAGTEYFSKNVTKDSGTGKWAIEGEPTWINGIPISFWSWNPLKPTRTGSNTATFSYTVSSTVSNQEDLVFAYNNETRNFNDQGEIQDGKDENVDIRFFHALSAIQFHKHENLSGYRISAIEIQQVDSHTECTMTCSNIVPSENNPNIGFSHTSSIPANFSQTYIANDPSLDQPSSGSSFNTDDGKTFFMIPQDFSTTLKVTFEYTGAGTSGETTSPVFEFNGTWEAGKYYVYKIDLTGNIHVDISESCTAIAKSNVKFQNTCNVNEYIRAAVVANWYDAGGNIVAAWDKSRDGDFTPGANWSLESDGFYYYSLPVATNTTTGNLFDSFTKPTDAPVEGAHFEMTILVQAVASDGLSSCKAAFTPTS